MKTALVTAFALVVALCLSQTGAPPGTAGPAPAPPDKGLRLGTPLGSAFTYQGSLVDGENAAQGTYQMQFKLYDAENAGTPLGTYPPSGTLAVLVQNGLFTAAIDFGSSPFGAEKRWLEVVVNGLSLTPRQELTVSPFTIVAGKVHGSEPSQIEGASSDPMVKAKNTAAQGVAIYGVATGAEGTGVKGQATLTGGHFEAAGELSIGVYAKATGLGARAAQFDGAVLAESIDAATGYFDDELVVAGPLQAGTAHVGGDVTAQGTIWSQSGGFKFPDGSTQTSSAAASGVPSGFCILGETSTPPPGYQYTGRWAIAEGTEHYWYASGPPTAGYMDSAATIANKIYVTIENYETFFEYDPVSDTWAQKANIPTPRYVSAATTANGKFYVIGGDASWRTTEEYDPPVDQWYGKTPMPTARRYFGAAAAPGADGRMRIYAIGGRDDTDNSPFVTNEEFDPENNEWQARTPMNLARFALAVVAAGGKIFAIGGMQDPSPDIDYWDQPTARNEEYDPVTDSWRDRSSLNWARGFHNAAELNGSIYVLGGVTALNPTYFVYLIEEYDPSTSILVTRMSIETDWVRRCSTSAVGRIYALRYLPLVYCPPTKFYVHRKQ